MGEWARASARSFDEAEVLETLRIHIYDAFTHTGAAPSIDDLAEMAGDVERARAAVAALADARQLALDSDGSIALAHPFAARSFGFSVMGESTLWWGGCAWDSFAIPHVVDEPVVLVATRCGGCLRPISVDVEQSNPPESQVVAHLATPMARVWDDVIRACTNQRLYCSSACLADWLSESDAAPGATLDAHALWRLARGWYQGRLERGYRRRDPADAMAYFASCGLTGPFWAEG